MNFLLKIFITAVCVILIAYLLPGVNVDNFLTAVIVALVLAILNGILKPVLIILTIPVTVLTFGLFLLVINALMILIASRLIDGFFVDGFWWALLFNIVLSFVSYLLGISKKN